MFRLTCDLMLPANQSRARLPLGWKRHFSGNEMHKVNMKEGFAEMLFYSPSPGGERVDGGRGGGTRNRENSEPEVLTEVRSN